MVEYLTDLPSQLLEEITILVDSLKVIEDRVPTYCGENALSVHFRRHFAWKRRNFGEDVAKVRELPWVDDK